MPVTVANAWSMIDSAVEISAAVQISGGTNRTTYEIERQRDNEWRASEAELLINMDAV